MHVRADKCSSERAVLSLESGAVSAHVTKHFVNILSKMCNKVHLFETFLLTLMTDQMFCLS